MRLIWRWKGLPPALVGLMALVAGSAQAASMHVSGWELGEKVEIRSPTHAGSVLTAELHISLDGVLGKSFCVDLAQQISLGDYAFEAAAPGDAHGTLEAAFLMESYGAHASVPDRRTSITALQLAIWETTHEYNDGPYSLAMGTFAVTDASAAALALAEKMLASLPSQLAPGAYAHFVLAQSPTHQDQLWRPKPIPEPNAALLLSTGGLLLASVLRRERTAD